MYLNSKYVWTKSTKTKHQIYIIYMYVRVRCVQTKIQHRQYTFHESPYSLGEHRWWVSKIEVWTQFRWGTFLLWYVPTIYFVCQTYQTYVSKCNSNLFNRIDNIIWYFVLQKFKILFFYCIERSCIGIIILFCRVHEWLYVASMWLVWIPYINWLNFPLWNLPLNLKQI